MTHTESAQRRLLEALASQERQTPNGLRGLRLALEYAIVIAVEMEQPALVDVYRALSALAEAVEADLEGGADG